MQITQTLRADQSCPLLFDLGPSLDDTADAVPATRGECDDPAATVVGMWAALDVPAPVQFVDELDRGLLGDAEVLAEFDGGGCRVCRQVLERESVCGAHVAEALAREFAGGCAGGATEWHAVDREEVFVLQDGRMLMEMADQVHQLTPGDAAIAAPGVPFRLRNPTAVAARLTVCTSKGIRGTVTGETIDPPWAQ